MNVLKIGDTIDHWPPGHEIMPKKTGVKSHACVPLMEFKAKPDLQAQFTSSLSVMSPLIGSNESVASDSLAPIGGYQKQVLPMIINFFV